MIFSKPSLAPRLQVTLLSLALLFPGGCGGSSELKTLKAKAAKGDAQAQNIAKGREWLVKAADQGDAEAKLELAATPVLPPASAPKR